MRLLNHPTKKKHHCPTFFCLHKSDMFNAVNRVHCFDCLSEERNAVSISLRWNLCVLFPMKAMGVRPLSS